MNIYPYKAIVLFYLISNIKNVNALFLVVPMHHCTTVVEAAFQI